MQDRELRDVLTSYKNAVKAGYDLSCASIAEATALVSNVAHHYLRCEDYDSIEVFVVYNINGDVIGVAGSYEEALAIHNERYDDTTPSISQFKLNELKYA